MLSLTYNMDVESSSKWICTTPGAIALKQPYLCTEAGLFFGNQWFSTARLGKDSYILFFTLKGAGLIEQGDQQLILPAGQALLMNCRTPQSYCTAPNHTCWHHYWIHIDGPGVRSMEEFLIPNQKLTPIPLGNMDSKSCFDTVLTTLQSGTVDSVMQMSLSVHRLLATMVHSHFSQVENQSSRQVILDAAAFIRRHYQDSLCLDLLVEQACLSKSYFLRLFRQYMGTTPYNYLLGYRISQAKELLLTTSLSVGAVASHVGFANESTFSTRFSTMTGQSPLQYRKSAFQISDKMP